MIVKQLQVGAELVFTNKERLGREEKNGSSMVEEYNKNMGGTDLMDENINRRRSAIL